MMADSVWSETPPTQPGWYWVLNRFGECLQDVAESRGGNWWWNGAVWGPEYLADEVKFGPRIPSAEELAALSRLPAHKMPIDPDFEAVLRDLFGVDDPKNRVTKLEEPT